MLKEFASIGEFVSVVVAEVANPDFTQSDPLILYGLDEHHNWQTGGAQSSFEDALRKSVESKATFLRRRGAANLDATDLRLLTLFGHVRPSEPRPKYVSARAYEALVCSAAQQILEHCYTLPVDRDDSDMYREHPDEWPLTEQSLRQPFGKRGKGFTGLTHAMRELLKYGTLKRLGRHTFEYERIDVDATRDIAFGLKVLAWFHRDVWNTGLKKAEIRTFGEYMRLKLMTGMKLDAYLSADDQAMLKELYGVENRSAA